MHKIIAVPSCYIAIASSMYMSHTKSVVVMVHKQLASYTARTYTKYLQVKFKAYEVVLGNEERHNIT